MLQGRSHNFDSLEPRTYDSGSRSASANSKSVGMGGPSVLQD
jgi:hypothetical protein